MISVNKYLLSKHTIGIWKKTPKYRKNASEKYHIIQKNGKILGKRLVLEPNHSWRPIPGGRKFKKPYYRAVIGSDPFADGQKKMSHVTASCCRSLNSLTEVEEPPEKGKSLGTVAHRHRSILLPGVKYVPRPWAL